MFLTDIAHEYRNSRRDQGLESENARLKKLLVDVMLENQVSKDALKKMVTAPRRRELVRWIRTKGLSERRALSIAGLSASELRYHEAARQHRISRPDRSVIDPTEYR